MAGGPAFLRPEHELTTRLCYVDFDGEMALKESVRVGLKDPLPEDFVKQYCTQMYDGMKVGYSNVMVLLLDRQAWANNEDPDQNPLKGGAV